MPVRSRLGSILLALAFLATSLTSCSSGGSQSSAQSEQRPDYNQTKTMMLDILHSKEGKDTLKDIIKEPTIKRSLVISDQDVSSAIVKTLSDDKNQKQILQAQMSDPKFAAAMVKAAKQEHQTMLKQLMKDPDYQQSILTLMKTPDFQNMVLTIMQSPEYRNQVMKIMADSLQNPEYKLVYMDVIKEAIRTGAGVSKMGTAGGGGQGGQQGGGQGGGGQGGGKKGGDQQGGQGGGSSSSSGGGDESGGGSGDGGEDGQKKEKKDQES